MKLSDFAKKIKTSFDLTGFSAMASSVLYREESKIVKLLQEHSPYDKGTYSGNWKVLKKKSNMPSSVKGKILSSLVIVNETPLYGQFIEGGAEPQSAPWYFPHRDSKTGKMKPWSGKLKIADGKVWPGGLNPGHSKTIGGAISIVANDMNLINKLSLELSDEIVKGMVR